MIWLTALLLHSSGAEGLHAQSRGTAPPEVRRSYEEVTRHLKPMFDDLTAARQLRADGRLSDAFKLIEKWIDSPLADSSVFQLGSVVAAEMQDWPRTQDCTQRYLKLIGDRESGTEWGEEPRLLHALSHLMLDQEAEASVHFNFGYWNDKVKDRWKLEESWLEDKPDNLRFNVLFAAMMYGSHASRENIGIFAANSILKMSEHEDDPMVNFSLGKLLVYRDPHWAMQLLKTAEDSGIKSIDSYAKQLFRIARAEAAKKDSQKKADAGFVLQSRGNAPPEIKRSYKEVIEPFRALNADISAARELRANGRLRDAFGILEKWFGQKPYGSFVHLSATEIAVELQDWPSALACSKLAIEDDAQSFSDNPPELLYALSCVMTGSEDEASTHFQFDYWDGKVKERWKLEESWLEDNPDNLKFNVLFAAMLYGSNSDRENIGIFAADSILKMSEHEDDPLVNFSLGKLLVYRDPHRAMKLLKTAENSGIKSVESYAKQLFRIARAEAAKKDRVEKGGG